VPGWGCILLDCGENTLGQLKRVFSSEELKKVLHDLRLIFISHMHADHHLGTVGVLKAWYAEVHESKPTTRAEPKSLSDIETLLSPAQKRLAIISEPAMLEWLSEYSAVEDYGFSHLAPINISPANTHKGKNSNLNWFIPPLQLAAEPDKEAMFARVNAVIFPPSLLNSSEINAVLVQHCHGARAFSITLPSGFKVSYSGDCRPSQSFQAIGKGSTVVIHEATFDDELAGDAVAKNHSTTSEALGVAQGMGAKACILTHFSQRYQKIPVLDATAGADPSETAIQNGSNEQQDFYDEDVVDAEMAANPDDSMTDPLSDLASTFPDQANGAGQQYDLPTPATKAQPMEVPRTEIDDLPFKSRSKSQPEAVKFKLKSDMKVCVAFDFMRVKVGEIWQLEKFTPALLRLLAEEEKVVEGVDEEVRKKGKKKKGKGG
jgi:ribonuclease Z